jgi:hypothetical protein
VDVLVPREVVEVALSTRDDEACRKCDWAAPCNLDLVFGLATEFTTVKVKEITTIISSETSASRAKEILREYE